jgi:hypothetical protein
VAWGGRGAPHPRTAGRHHRNVTVLAVIHQAQFVELERGLRQQQHYAVGFTASDSG